MGCHCGGTGDGNCEPSIEKECHAAQGTMRPCISWHGSVSRRAWDARSSGREPASGGEKRLIREERGSRVLWLADRG